MRPASVDVLIPVFNAASTVRAAVESMLAQTLRDIRIVIVDDGSRDETPAILKQLHASDPRIAIVTKPNGGLVDALNTGLRHCRADYVARFDADDIAFPGRLEKQLQYLEAYPGTVAVGCAVEHIDAEGRPVAGLPHPGSPALADARRIPATEPYLIHPYLMVRRAGLLDVGGYRHVHNSEDSDLYWRLSEIGDLHNLPDVLGYYRMHAESISGASVLNGRIMAVSSQLAALSALRRRRGAPDIAFNPQDKDRYRAAGTLAGMVRIASEQLDEREAEHLRLAASIKLLELAGYRPYEPDITDCAFIRSALPYAKALPAGNRNEVRWHCTTTAARLARKGRYREALQLSPPAFLPYAVAKAMLR